MGRTILDVTGMACDGCEANVTEALEAADEVRVEHDGETNTATIRETIDDAGYEVVA